MNEILLFEGERFQRRIPLQTPALLVGRGKCVDLSLDGPGISRQHVRLNQCPEGLRFQDLGSTNGVSLEGRILQEGLLTSGMALEVGGYRLLYLRRSEVLPARTGVEELYLLSARISATSDPHRLVETMLDAAMQTFEADRGLVLTRSEAGTFEVEVSRGLDPRGEPFRASQTIARQAATRGTPVVLANSQASGALHSPSIEASSARSILAAPILAPEETDCQGVVYLDGPASLRVYSDRDRDLLATLALHVGAAMRALARRQKAEQEARRLKQLQRDGDLSRGDDPRRLVAVSAPMQTLVRQLEAVAKRSTTALILGESGTGKELLARAIHEKSPRREGPFVPVNCMALVSDLAATELFGHEKGAFTGADGKRVGRFELADGGTLFLDEVGELSLEMQVRLLRVLEERCIERVGGNRSISIDVRVVAATNRDMLEAIQAGEFREDLWYRLKVFPLQVPPLRDRPEDIPALVENFITHFNGSFGREIEGIHPEALQKLEAYPWPGNVRELRNVIERAFVLEDQEQLQVESLPFEISGEAPKPSREGILPRSRDFSEAKRAFEEAFLRRALIESEGNLTKAAESAGIPRKTIYRKLKDFDLKVEEILCESLGSKPPGSAGL